MTVLLLVSHEPLAGKTTLAVGLAQRLQEQGRSVALLRLPGGDDADADAALFAGLPFNSCRTAQPAEPAAALNASRDVDVALIEAPAGDPAEALAALAGAKAILVAAGASAPEEIVQRCHTVGGSLAGLVLNRTPQGRRDSIKAALESAGLQPLALLPEDRTLAAPTLGQVAQALQARTDFLDSNALWLVDRPLVASISADPGQGYFARYRPSAVIVRGDKPDLQLAALNAGAPCLIITGGLAPLSYVLDRAEDDQIPLLRTDLDTVTTVQRIEALFGTTPFAGGEAKLRRLRELLAGFDLFPATATK